MGAMSHVNPTLTGILQIDHNLSRIESNHQDRHDFISHSLFNGYETSKNIINQDNRNHNVMDISKNSIKSQDM